MLIKYITSLLTREIIVIKMIMDRDSKEREKERTASRQIDADLQKHEYSLHYNHYEQGSYIISKCGWCGLLKAARNHADHP